MGNCDKYRDMMGCLLDGELSEENKRLLHTHLDGCPGCRRVFDAYSVVSKTLSEDLAEPPEELVSGIMARLENGARRDVRRTRARRFTPLKLVGLAASLAVILYAGARLEPWNRSDRASKAGAPPEAMAEADRKSMAESPADAADQENKAALKPEEADRAFDAAGDAASGPRESDTTSGTGEPDEPAPAPPPEPFTPGNDETGGSQSQTDGGSASTTVSDDPAYTVQAVRTTVVIRNNDKTLLQSDDPALAEEIRGILLCPGNGQDTAPDREADYSLALTEQGTGDIDVYSLWQEEEVLWYRNEPDGDLTLSAAPASALLDYLEIS
jgi:hypothetical protein